MQIEPRIDRRIFVVGVPRSGTTLVQSLLAAHSTMTSFTESHFFDRHFSHLPFVANPILTRNPGPRLHEFLTENGEKPPAAACELAAKGRGALLLDPLLPFQTQRVARQLLRILDELTRRRGKSGWIEKTPKHLRYIPLLEKISSPETRLDFVHVIRDGLEVVASLHQASQSWERPYGLKSCIRRWNIDVGFSLRRALTSTDHFILYEELTSQPEATLRELLAGLRLDWEPDMLTRYARTADQLVTEQETWKADVGRDIRRSATSNQVLSTEQREQVKRSLHLHLYEQLLAHSRRRSGETGRT